tara:strand:+ start:1143 stop:1442 length:300 start_codon:yes stop_codon:yes gene_type:complete
MAAVAHSPAFAKKAGVPQSVGKEFTTADKNRKFSKGGDTMATAKKVPTSPMGKVKTAAPSRDGMAMKGKTKGTQIKMAGSGVPKGIGSKVMKKGGMAKC